MTDTERKQELTQEDKDSFIQKVRSRRELISLAFDENETGLWDLLAQQYPDSVHFIYELLQNAEDAGATEVSFDLSDDCLGFEHNGRPFSQDDIWSITTVALSSKSNNDDTIGRFGIGFKSVFVYTRSPKIWSTTYSFIIEDFVIPYILQHRDELRNLTRFEFPFNNPKKRSKDAFSEISKKLQKISEDTLLFLNNISSIEWKIGKDETGLILRVVGKNCHVEVMKQVNSEITSSSHFLLFSEPIKENHTSSTQCVSIAYALDLLPNIVEVDELSPLSDQVNISPVRGNVAVFFPAVKETSGLRFHLHAPFVSVPSRDSIKETEANDPLFSALANLCCKSLHKIRDEGLLTKDFFKVLPNSKDSLIGKYSDIREHIIQEFNNEPLMPTFMGGYAPAKTLCQAREALKNLLTREDLVFLGNFDSDSQVEWAINSDLQGTEVESFMSSTEIRNWGIDKFVDVLSTQLNRNAVSKSHLNWLLQKPTSWLQMFYATFDSDYLRCANRLANSLIVKLASGKFSTGKGSYFPSEDYQSSESMPYIDIDIVEAAGGAVKAQNRRFLEALGVVEIDEFQSIKLLLENYHNRDDLEFDENRSVAHLEKFVQVFGQSKDRYHSIFSESKILYGSDERWHKPCEIFIDTPFEDTDMLAYYNCFNRPKNLAGLSEKYFYLGVDKSKLIDFATSLGAIRSIPVIPTSCKENPNKVYLLNASGSRVSRAAIDQDWYIQSFCQIAENMNMAMSKLILRSIMDLEERDQIDIRMRAKYRKSLRGETRHELSQLAFQLRDSAWIPQAGGKFVKPSQAKYEELPGDFVVNRDSLWVRQVNFGNDVEMDAADKKEKDRRRKDALATLGFDSNRISELEPLFRKLASLPLERIPDIIREIDNPNVPFPEGEAVRGDQRGERVRKEARDAPDRVGVVRMRTVQMEYFSVKDYAKKYLMQQYTDNGNMLCQICHGPMPFKLCDGSPFVIKVEFLRDCNQRHYRNHLSLCPNHAAMFIHANQSENYLRDMVRTMEGLKLDVLLAQETLTIRFTEKHIHDIKNIIEEDHGLPKKVS